MLAQDNVIDRSIAKLPLKMKKILADRYKLVHPFPDEMKFIDRIETDSRHEALAHTGGLSCPQQAIMSLFSLFELLDKNLHYKRAVHQLLVQRMRNLFCHLPLPMPSAKGNTYYYVLLDIIKLARKKYSEAFANHLKKNLSILEFVYRLAKEKCTICLPGEGFHGSKLSIRISLANLEEADYLEVGKNIDELLTQYYEAWNR